MFTLVTRDALLFQIYRDEDAAFALGVVGVCVLAAGQRLSHAR